MDVELPESINLSLVQVELAQSNQFPELEAKLRQALVSQSCVVDLREAEDALSALLEVIDRARGWKSVARAATEAALLSTAISLYARATSTNAKKGERGPIQIDKGLTDEQLADHQSLLDIRSRAVAHVYTNSSVAGLDWHRSAVLLIKQERGWTPAVANRRVQLDPNTIERLSRMIPIAKEKITARAQQRTNEVAFAIAKVPVAEKPALNRIFDRCRLDVVAFFDSVENAQSEFAKMHEATVAAPVIG